MKRKIRGNAGVGLSFVVVLIIFLVIQLVMPTSKYSTVEKRTLDTAPNFSVSDYLDGTYQSSFESYTNDQFPAKNALVQSKTDVDILFGSRKLQDVYILPDMLAQDFSGCDEEKINEKATSINTFINKYSTIRSSFILVPNKISIYQDQFPTVDNILDQKKCIDQFTYKLADAINVLDTYTVLNEHKKEELYYKSDHHWTTWAAQYTFNSWLDMQEIEDKKIEYDNYILTENFVGSLANQISYTKFKDRINILIPKDNKTNYIVDYGNDKQVASVYDSKASEVDPYTVFFGGNHPIFTINTDVDTDKKIIIFKDSYANCFIPLLIPYYSQITVVDSRYYYDDINEVMKNNSFTDMLFLYNANTYFSDTSLQELLKEQE